MVVVNVEAVGKNQGIACFQVGLDFGVVYRGLLFIRKQDHYNVCSFCSLSHSHYLQTVTFGLCPAGTAFPESDNNIEPGLVKVSGVSVALASIAHHCDGFVFKCIKSGLIIVNYRCHA